VFVGISLDGFLARADGSLDWLTPFAGEDHGYDAFIASVDTLVIGRGTYDFVLGMLATGEKWPYSGKRCAVMTHRPIAGKNGETACSGEPAALLEQLAREGAKHVYVDGGVVIRSFLAAGLIDEMTISVAPKLIGTGLPLFGGVAIESGLALEGVRAFKNGLAQLRYRAKQ
jgi:dihydrofolate reductase